MVPRLLTVLLSIVVIGASCGGAEQVDYSSANTLEFFAACTRPLEDSRLVTQICDCVFAEIQSDIDYERFVEIEEELIEASEAAELAGEVGEVPLPPELAEIVARCVSEEANL